MRTYRRVVAERRGGPEVLRVVEEPLREPEAGKIRIRTLVSGISFADIFMRQGLHPEALVRRFPLTPGWDIVGYVDALGPGVEVFTPGDLVAALPIAGGVGTALLQLGKLEQLKMYGTASAGKHRAISELGGSPIDYRSADFVSECLAREPQGLDAVFDGIGGMHLLRSLRVLRRLCPQPGSAP